MHRTWHEAAVDGDCETLRAFLAQKADINRLDKYGQTALMLAAVQGNDAVVEMLIEYGAEFDVTAKYGLSALMLAIINHHENTARLLIHANADIRLRGHGAPGFMNKTAFDLARDRGLSGSTDFLIRSAADRRENSWSRRLPIGRHQRLLPIPSNCWISNTMRSCHSIK